MRRKVEKKKKGFTKAEKNCRLFRDKQKQSDWGYGQGAGTECRFQGKKEKGAAGFNRKGELSGSHLKKNSNSKKTRKKEKRREKCRRGKGSVEKRRKKKGIDI